MLALVVVFFENGMHTQSDIKQLGRGQVKLAAKKVWNPCEPLLVWLFDSWELTYVLVIHYCNIVFFYPYQI